MIDLHSHILPGLDDGASCLEDSLSLIRNSINDDVTHILATPHIHFGTFDNDMVSIKTAFNSLCEYIDNHGVSINLAYAAEIRISPEIIQLVEQKQIPFMGKYEGADIMLLEFPHSHILPGSEKLIDWLIKKNIKPMIAHPERNRDVWKYPEAMQPFIKRNCLLQITASSLLGDFGERSKKHAWSYIESGDATIVASDMHNLKRRPNKMKEAYNLVQKRFGLEVADSLFINTPQKIIETNPTLQLAKALAYAY
ncbi:MAG: CpsB/CapC family capsule biosynthesis tyrosine phosphatase [Psychromonas sp.]